MSNGIATYISGKITGYDLDFAKGKFNDTAELLLMAGRTPVNPFDLSEFHPDKTWEDYMLDDIRGLFKCKSIVMHSDWPESKGARVEMAIASALELEILTENDLIELTEKQNAYTIR